MLQRGTCNILKGKEEKRLPLAIKPGMFASMKVKASKNGRGRIRCYLVYELVRDGRRRRAIMRNYRAFLAIVLFSTTITNNCAASAAVFMVKDRYFKGEIDDVDWLYNDVLRHHRIENGSSFKCNLAGQVLTLDVGFRPDRQARIKVMLKETEEHLKYGPVFHRANYFA
jgi:hypothetical protein